MDSDLAQVAINAALNENWEEAIKANSSILKIEPTDIDALNRMAKAYAETGDLNKAKETTKKVLKLDPTNIIANKCQEKWNNFKKLTKTITSSKGIAKIFIEEPTKTKLITLINLGDPISISTLDCGDTMKMVTHPHR